MAGIAEIRALLNKYKNAYDEQGNRFWTKGSSDSEEDCIPFEHMPSGIDDISIIIRRSISMTKKSRIMERIAKELRVDSINLEYDWHWSCSRARNDQYSRYNEPYHQKPWLKTI